MDLTIIYTNAKDKGKENILVGYIKEESGAIAQAENLMFLTSKLLEGFAGINQVKKNEGESYTELKDNEPLNITYRYYAEFGI